MKEVLVQYQKNDTGMKQNEKPITDHPTLTICLSHDSITYDYGRDFNITYFKTLLSYTEDKIDYDVHEVKDSEGFVIKYQRVHSYDDTNMCFRLQRDSSNLVIKNEFVYSEITFQKSQKELPMIEVYFTSRANAEGIVFKEFMDGYELKKIFEQVIMVLS